MISVWAVLDIVVHYNLLNCPLKILSVNSLSGLNWVQITLRYCNTILFIKNIDWSLFEFLVILGNIKKYKAMLLDL